MFIFHLLTKIVPDSYLSAQFKKPTGLFGKHIIGNLMDIGNAELHNFTLEQMDLQPGQSVLEIGFGTGNIMRKIHKTTDGFTAGIDFSEDMVKTALKNNQDLMKKETFEIRKADISKIPYKDESFDSVYTANTVYFWPDPVKNAKEIMRVIKKKGSLYIGFRLKEEMDTMSLTDTNFTKYSEEDLRKLFSDAGFTNYKMVSKEGNGPFPSHTAVITKN